MSNQPVPSIQEIYALLGLEDPDAFALKKIHEAISSERVKWFGPSGALRSVFRSTGRTTRVAVEAIGALLNGQRVWIFTRPPFQAEATRARIRDLLTEVLAIRKESSRFVGLLEKVQVITVPEKIEFRDFCISPNTIVLFEGTPAEWGSQ